jgi:SAM-dependent methyltransferase
MDTTQWTPADMDLQRPNAARVYDFYLGGSHNFAVDRQMAQQAIALWPEVPMIIRANRGFLRRAVRFLVRAGVRQFLDLGSGMPTVGNVHEVAHADAPDARVVYVDIDPVAVAHAGMILGEDPNAGVIQADLRRPDAVLTHPRLRRLLDLDQPVAVLMVAVLHFVPDADNPAAIIGQYRKELASGSYLAISHATGDGQQERQTAEHQSLYDRTATPMTMRSRDAITHLLQGWQLIDPGLVRLPLWRPEPGEAVPHDPQTFAGYAALCRNGDPAERAT